MRWLALLSAGGALGLLAYHVQVDDLHSPVERAATQVAIGWAFLGAGVAVLAWRRGRRMGLMLVLAAFALLVRQLRYSNDPYVFTLFFVLGDLGYALVGHAVLAYPTGRLRGRFERALVIAAYAVCLIPLAVVLVYDDRWPLLQFTAPRESVVAIVHSHRATELLQQAQVLAFYGVLATVLIVLILRDVMRATPRTRRVLAPLVVAAVAIGLRAVFECVFTFVDRPFAYDYLFWWQVVAVLALPVALLVGLFRAHLARTHVGDLVIELEHTPTSGLRDALARALGDPSLELALALPGGRGFVDDDGRTVILPEGDPRREVTRIDTNGEVIAALIHDPSLRQEPERLQATGAAAHLALENARLQAELRAQLTLLAESRARIVVAGDEERRRLERDLHDGAQQRLVALAIELRTAQRRHGAELDPAVEQLLSTAVADLQVAVEELRELARGIHPTILAEGGLAAALDLLGTRSPIPVEVDVTHERFAPDVEATAYFVACEALANVAKHAGATKATLAAGQVDDVLRVEVADNGVGGARVERGTGVRGLADRVEARGGHLSIESPTGGGTRVVAEIPCGS